MTDFIYMYDDKEKTETRYIGFVGEYGRFDLMITTTAHFYGKKVVTCLQSNRSAILNEKDAVNALYLEEAFGLGSEDMAKELSRFLVDNL
ncbi:DUF3055 domain-containing protein [Effusibacillus dendaii]|uniref:DUF3055 domain-containing protein n=1 Tax=Effusibacillus dendaii TaxID=2743772 RepID=UPI001CF7A16A|nr:DUF3055 domain-containing protein [Effusibacillus dendaii]